MLSPYRFQPIITNKRTKKSSNTHLDNNSHGEKVVKRLQLTSIDVVKNNTITEATLKHASNKKNKDDLRGEGVHENIEINDEYLNENIHNNNI